MRRAPSSAVHLAASSEGAPRRRPIALVVDDDVDLASMTAMALGTQGWHAIAANTPYEAASIARDLPIDVLVTDLNMPGMSGQELAALVRAQRGGLPVVLVSGWPEASSLVVEQPFAFLPKPFRLQALFAAVASLAGGAGETRPPAPASFGTGARQVVD